MTNIALNTQVVLTKGCLARQVAKGDRAEVVFLKEGEGGTVRVGLAFLSGASRGKTWGFTVRHRNRLADAEVRANTGNPLEVIMFRAR